MSITINVVCYKLENSVNSHRQNILQKLKANNSIEAVNFAQRLGLFDKCNIDKSKKRDVLP